MFRISITYGNQPGAPFDWDYYMNRHLPLAVGTSRRHSGLNFCDVDRSLNDTAPHVCVCMVHFDSESSMRNFCDFFVNVHPESDRINNDEHNYTTIPPGMVAAECAEQAYAAKAETAGFRSKLFFPFREDASFSRDSVVEQLQEVVAESGIIDAGLVATQLDFCSSGIVAGSAPDYSLICSFCFAQREQMERGTQKILAHKNTKVFTSLAGSAPEVMLAEVLPFDIALSEPHRLAEE